VILERKTRSRKRTAGLVGSNVWFDNGRAAESKNQTGAVNPSPTLPAIETSLDNRSPERASNFERPTRDELARRRALRSSLKPRTLTWRRIRAAIARFAAPSKRFTLVVRIQFCVERMVQGCLKRSGKRHLQPIVL